MTSHAGDLMIQKVVEQRKEVDVTRTAAMGHQAAGSPKKGGEVRGPPFFFWGGREYMCVSSLVQNARYTGKKQKRYFSH